jgi:hypothetical protein
VLNLMEVEFQLNKSYSTCVNIFLFFSFCDQSESKSDHFGSKETMFFSLAHTCFQRYDAKDQNKMYHRNDHHVNEEDDYEEYDDDDVFVEEDVPMFRRNVLEDSKRASRSSIHSISRRRSCDAP